MNPSTAKDEVEQRLAKGVQHVRQGYTITISAKRAKCAPDLLSARLRKLGIITKLMRQADNSMPHP